MIVAAANGTEYTFIGASMSSTRSWSEGEAYYNSDVTDLSASKCIDGSISGTSSFCSTSLTDTSAWWASFDLGVVRSVCSVKVYNRGDWNQQNADSIVGAIVSLRLDANGADSWSRTITSGGTVTNTAVQHVTIAASRTSFALGKDGQMTGEISMPATATAVKTALEALSTVVGSITVTRDSSVAASLTYQVTFNNGCCATQISWKIPADVRTVTPGPVIIFDVDAPLTMCYRFGSNAGSYSPIGAQPFTISTTRIYDGSWGGGGCLGAIKITIASHVTEIADNAFHQCTAVTAVDFSAARALTRINSSAFDGMTALTTVDLRPSYQLLSIGIGAFQNCANLASLQLPSSVVAIGDRAFAQTALSSPAAVTFNGGDCASARAESGGTAFSWPCPGTPLAMIPTTMVRPFFFLSLFLTPTVLDHADFASLRSLCLCLSVSVSVSVSLSLSLSFFLSLSLSLS